MFHGIYYEARKIPQLLADIGAHVWVVVWEFILGQPCYYPVMLLLIKSNECVVPKLYEGGLNDKWLHYADVYPDGMDVFIHSSLNVLNTSVHEEFWEDADIFLFVFV